MYYTETIQLDQAEALLTACGLSKPEGVDYTVGVFNDDGRLVATGSLKGDMIQGMAVDPAFQGEDLMAKVLTALIGQAKDAQTLYLFTKPEKSIQFTGLGFRLVAKARPYAALLEWGKEQTKEYEKKLQAVRAGTLTLVGKEEPVVGALVMNCNPFTLGHRYLVEEAAKACDHVYVLVVEEDLSRFPFQHRLKLVQEGTSDLDNVTVIAGGRYAVSTLTFPSYFTKEEKVADAHAAMDAELFVTVIAPALGATKRFVGTEPLSPVTNIYNESLKTRLPKHGIEVVELVRKEEGDLPISASRVRALLDEGGAKAWEELKTLVPKTTYDYLDQNHHKVTLMELLDAREARVIRQQKLLGEHDGILVSMTLNIPGPLKDKPEYRKALEMGMERIKGAVGQDAIVHDEVVHLMTGSEGYVMVDGDAYDKKQIKAMTVAIEEADSLGRLFDMDVMDKNGSMSRGELGANPRKCLLCDEDAKVCARSQKHEMAELLDEIQRILVQE